MSKGSTARVVTWDGRELPFELRDLPPGRYTVEPLEDWGLSAKEEAGIDAGAAAIDGGEGVPGDVAAEQLRQLIAAKRP